MIHANLNPQAVVINGRGEWKLCGFEFCVPAKAPPVGEVPYFNT
jgi:hypothetical protein